MQKYKKNLLVTLADKKFLDQAKQLFSSAYFSGNWQGDFLLLSFDIDDNDLKWFLERGILVKKCGAICQENDLKQYYFFKEKRFPLIVNSKFYLFTEYFKNWGNIVFLDADIIVLSSLNKLTKVKNFWAAEDVLYKLSHQFIDFNDLNCDEDKLLFEKLKSEYNLSKNAFNSGVMAFSSQIIKNNSFDNLKNIFLHFKNITHMADQAALNLIFYQNWKELPAVYNASSLFLEKDNKIKSPLVHFNSGPKTWSTDSKFNNLWKKNLLLADEINRRPQEKNIAMLDWVDIWLSSRKLKKAYRKWLTSC